MLSDLQIEQLKKIKELFDSGILTEEEYLLKKNEVLNEVEIGASNSQIRGNDIHETKEEYVQTVSSTPEEARGKSNNAGIAFEYTPKKRKNKVKKPFYKRKWFIGLVIVFVLLIGLGALGSDEETSSDNGSTTEGATTEETSSTSEENEVAKTEQAKVISISASYSGDTSKGVMLDESNSGIKVTAKYDDQSSEDIEGWTIKSPAKLKAGKKAKVKIEYEGKTCELSVKCTSQTKKQYRKSCKKISYKKLARKPDKYTGKNIRIYGKVVQVMEDGNDVELRVATKDDGYGYYDDVVYVLYTYSKSDSKILEDDMVKVYGVSTGTISYQSTMSGTITIPSMVAQQIKVQ